VELLHTLWNAESSAGYILITSYRIPILWEHVHLKLARQLYRMRSATSAANSESASEPITQEEEKAPLIDQLEQQLHEVKLVAKPFPQLLSLAI